MLRSTLILVLAPFATSVDIEAQGKKKRAPFAWGNKLRSAHKSLRG